MQDFSLKGHMTPTQYMSKMSNFEGDVNPKSLSPEEDVELGDIDIEDVSPKKEKVPFLTKRGKIVVALLIVGGALYYIWKRSQSNKANNGSVEAPKVDQKDAERSEMTAETSSQTAQNSSQEDGVEGADLV